MTLSAIRPNGRRTYDLALRPMHSMRGDREIEIMRDDLVRILYGAVSDDVDISASPDTGRALGLWERGFRSNVEQNKRLATDGMATLPAEP
jgi:hypothetical protein